MSRYKAALLGSGHSGELLKSCAETELELCFARQRESFISLVSLPVPVNNALHNLALKQDDLKEELLFDSCAKEIWNLLLANRPQVILVDFLSDVFYGVLEINGETYITNLGDAYKDNILFQSLIVTGELCVEKDFEPYLSLWKKSFGQFMDFIKQYLPRTKVLINDCRQELPGGDDARILHRAMDEMLGYAVDFRGCRLIEDGLRPDDFEDIDERELPGAVYNLVTNSDFRSGTLFWKKWDSAYRAEGKVLKFSDTYSEEDAWHLLLSNEIEVCPGEVLCLSFECRIMDKELMKDKRIFTIRTWDKRHCIGLQNCRDNIAISWQEQKCDGEHFYSYEYSFMPQGRLVSVGPEIRQKGIVEYRNIMLTAGGHDAWHPSYLEDQIVPPEKTLADVNKIEQLYLPRKERENEEAEEAAQGEAGRVERVDLLNTGNCYGCGACQAACPRQAVEMKDILGEGFLYPVIDEEKCIDCGLCAKACPSIHRYSGKIVNPKVFAVKNEPEIAEKSSSAGVFYILAKYVLERGGFVSGAVYDEEFNVRHVLSDDWNMVQKMRKSKYVQSNTGNVYSEIREKLERGNFVLFTGTPCQAAGLLTFLGREYDRLLTMDVICHGVPSPGIWRKYLDENWEVGRLESIDFRHRGNRSLYGSQFLRFTLKNGNDLIYDKPDNSYYKAFQADLGLRKTCEHCEYAVVPRAADFSVGDWWGIRSVRPDLLDGDKPSLLMINSKKALALYETVEGEFKDKLEISLQQALANNRSQVSCNTNPRREYFFELIRNGNDFNHAVRKSLFPQYDVIIVGSTLSGNYGAIMTNYALYRAVENMGYHTALANYPLKEVPEHSLQFFTKYTELAPAEKDYKEYNWMTDTFLLGSDQVWNYACFEHCRLQFYLDFADRDKKKIAYASSFGFDYLTMYEKGPNQYSVANRLMKRFDHISVREQGGVEISRQDYAVEANWVLDPVFLLSGEEYASLSKKASRKPVYKYMTSYFLTAREQFNDLLRFVSEYLKLPMVNMITGNPAQFMQDRKKSIEPVCENLSMEEWLYNIQNSDFVVTDSFHCTCFSIIFQKKFITIQKGWALSRLTSLLSMLGLQDRLIGSFDEMEGKEYLLDAPIDYEKVHKILREKRAESLKWLEGALNAPKRTMEHWYLDRRDMYLEGADWEKVAHLSDYLERYRDNCENYVLAACTYGDRFDRESVRLLVENCMECADLSERELEESVRVRENLLTEESVKLSVRGNGKRNCRTLGIQIKESELQDMIQNPHEVYYVSFDWNTSAPGGSFRMELSQAPWDKLTGDIEVSRGAGHYESIYMSSAGIRKFESGILQIRTDDLEGELCIENLKLERGNRPIRRYVSSNDLNGFALICDAAERYLELSAASLGRLEYQTGNTRILLEYSNRGYRNCGPVSELMIENGNRDIYPLKRDGLYLMLLSKRQQKLVDISYSNPSEGGSLIHM